MDSSIPAPASEARGRHRAPPSVAHRPVRLVIVSLFALSSVSAARETQTFNGTISDDICAKAGHSQMQMGPTDGECTKACVRLHGASYVLYDGTTVYTLSDQKQPEAFAGQKVRVVGTLDAKTSTIRVESIAAAR